MKLISWNVNSLGSSLDTLNQIIKDHNPDFIGLQEVKRTAENITELLTSIIPTGYTVLINSVRGYAGTVLIIKTHEVGDTLFKVESNHQEFEVVDNKWSKYSPNRMNIGTFITNNQTVKVINTYIPNSSTGFCRLDLKTEFMASMFDLIRNFKSRGYQVILMGDVNIAPFKEDVKNSSANFNKTPGHSEAETKIYLEMLSHLELVDVHQLDKFSDMKSPEYRYTYWNQRNPNARKANSGWRLDHFWISDEINPTNYKILNNYLTSDHCPILLEV